MSKTRIRVCVPYPNHGAISPETANSLRQLKACNDFFVEVREVQGSSISVLRNVGINGGVSQKIRQQLDGFDYYLTVDADIAFSPEHLKQLIDRDLDVVGAAYQFRNQSSLAVAGYFDVCEGDVHTGKFTPFNAPGIREVDWIGAGFTLIKKRVLDAMEFPWYRELVIQYEEKGERHARWVGEDVGFCIGARQAGFKIYCDGDCRVQHITRRPEESKKKVAAAEMQSAMTLDEAAISALAMLDQVKMLVKGFHLGLKDVETGMGEDEEYKQGGDTLK